jgi:hypothetical protein
MSAERPGVQPEDVVALLRRYGFEDVDDWPLLEEVEDLSELPTVEQWLEADGQMREVT